MDQSFNKYLNINSDHYDFLWKFGVHYLFCSMYAESGYSSRDFVFYNSGFNSSLFISKDEQERLGKDGLALYLSGYPEYEERIKNLSGQRASSVQYIRGLDLSALSNEQLAEEFMGMKTLVVSLWDDYFVTEYHHTGLVTEILEKNDTRYDLATIRKNLEAMGHLKLQQRRVINNTLYDPSVIDIFTDEIKRRFAFTGDFNNYSYQELHQFILGKKVMPPDRSFVIWGRFSEGKDIIGNDAIKIIGQLQKIDSNAQVIKGNIGNKGFYRGVVKKIEFSVETNFTNEISNMTDGQVLVAGSTGPEMILACKKAGAIVTDEGGIISHAVIISRELNIPSVIGTKIATQVLKDGDLIEVDANKGMVKIIKRAEIV